MIRLSILIPAYNVERYISRCLDSILSQIANRNDVELVVVDDGSTDATAEILCAYEKKNNLFFRIITKENEGVGAARNLLIESSKGEYIWFVDSDDYIQTGCLGEILNIIDDEKGGDIFILLYRETQNNKVCNWINYQKKLYRGNGLEYLSKRKPCIYGYLWNKVYRKNLIISNGLLFDGGLISQEDWLFNMKLFPLVKLVVETNIQSYNYYLDNLVSTMHNQDVKHIQNNINNSLYTQIEYNRYISSFISNRWYSDLKHWRNYAVSGFLYSLLINRISLVMIKKYLNVLHDNGLYPAGRSLNMCSTIFLMISNVKFIYLFLCRLNLLWRNR